MSIHLPDVTESTLPPRRDTSRLHTRHRELMQRLVAGEPLASAARDLGFSMAAAKAVAKSPLFQKELQRMQTELTLHLYDAMAELKGLQPDAVDALRDVVNLKANPALRLAAARQILDRTGVGTVKQVKVDHTTLSYEERLQIVQQGGELPTQERYVEIEGFTETKILSGSDLNVEDTDS